MKLIVKKLQGGDCTLDVHPSTSIIEIKRLVRQQLNIPVEEQKLLFLGRTLLDELTIDSYPSIKEGSKLNLVVKKPDGFYEVFYKAFKRSGMSELEAKNTANRFIKVVQDKFNKLSWDDVDRLAMDCLREENGQRQNTDEIIM